MRLVGSGAVGLQSIPGNLLDRRGAGSRNWFQERGCTWEAAGNVKEDEMMSANWRDVENH